MSTEPVDALSEGEDLSDAELAYLDGTGELPAEEITPTPSEAEAPEPETPAEEITSEADGEADPEGADGDEAEGKTVPLKALHAEREERKRMRDDLAAERQLRQDLLNELRSRAGKDQAPDEKSAETPPVPDLETHPFDYIKHRDAEFEALKAQVSQTTQQQQQAEARGRFEMAVAQEAQRFKLEKPDYDDRLQHVAAHFVQNAKLQGYNDADAQAIANEGMMGLAFNVAQKGGNPVEYVYNMAEAVLGYQAKPAEVQPPAATKPQVDEKTRNSFRSQSSASGAANTGIDGKKIADMSDDEFEALDLSDAELDRIMKKYG